MKIVLFVHSIVSDWNNGHALETIRQRHPCDLRAEQRKEIGRALAAKVG